MYLRCDNLLVFINLFKINVTASDQAVSVEIVFNDIYGYRDACVKSKMILALPEHLQNYLNTTPLLMDYTISKMGNINSLESIHNIIKEAYEKGLTKKSGRIMLVEKVSDYIRGLE